MSVPDWVGQMQRDSAKRQHDMSESIKHGLLTYGTLRARRMYREYSAYQVALSEVGQLGTFAGFQLWQRQLRDLRQQQPGFWVIRQEPSQAAVGEIWSRHVDIIRNTNGGTQ